MARYKMNRYMINPADFKHYVELQELLTGIDTDNIPFEDWVTIWKTRAKIRNNTSYNEEIENGDRSNIKKTITIRFPKHIKGFDAEDSNRYKIKYNDKLYKILSMSDVKEEKRFVEMKVGAWD